jgi:excisionase family DNA binding protein
MSIHKDAAHAADGRALAAPKTVSLIDRAAWSVAEFGALHGCGRATVYRWAQRGIISLSKSGGRTFITREAVEAWKGRMAAGVTAALR